ncbi:NAD(P)H-dependent glycerol-3-phosphate dehydrogenase [Sphingobacterium bovistauri]|uniref:Glycerol-3-phosphate dehydrogenase n=1 Tax=Sphingobacterium bovistauri TaxID=2781959 RepID=A0ABS7Z065_9SPHI|nr:NAD(P)H-dependent glycerol-3-phosphate dehydrogenase [Sphingobacterium bovistauri]MCA5003560.1 NAD(P)-binding domain-containing protein [Sphingobacterium bovistauri]
MDKHVSNKIGVIGSGSWATAMIKMLTDNQSDKEVYWWVRKDEDIEYIQSYKHNPSYLTAVEIKMPFENISSDVKYIVNNSEIIILNTPAAYLKDALKELTSDDFDGKIIVSAIKGIIPDENQIVGEYLTQTYGIPLENILVVGGPCHAEEVSQEKLSYLTFGCNDLKKAEMVAGFYRSRYINTIISDDILGIEYGAVLKNIYALAGGICHGLGFGDNFQAVLVSNAIREMEYFVETIDSTSRDINASAYLGDLLVTAYSQFSRNRTFGNMIGKGYSVKSAQLEMNMVAEGYYASNCIQGIIARYELDMPICNMVYQILYNNSPAPKEVNTLAKKLS